MLPFADIPRSPVAIPENSAGMAAANSPLSLRRIELVRQNHSFAQNARLRVAPCRFLGRSGGKLMQDALEFLVEEARDEFGRVQDGLALLVDDAGDVAMTHPLRDHQAIDAVG